MNFLGKKIGPIVVIGLVSMIVIVFVFSAGYDSNFGRSPGIAGKVNGDTITGPEFNRVVERQLNFYRSMGQIPDPLLSRIRQNVFQELVRQKLVLQEANRLGMIPSRESIREEIRNLEYFKTDGKFDVTKYTELLKVNKLSPAEFEGQISDNLAVQNFYNYIRSRVKVDREEVKEQFLIENNKRQVKYVFIGSSAAKRDVSVSEDEIKKYLEDPAKFNLAKSDFERRKASEFKNKKFDQVKLEVARELVASEKIEELRKANEALAERVSAKLNGGSDRSVEALLKPYQLSVAKSPMLSELTQYVPGIGEIPELSKDAFDSNSDLSRGKTKLYRSAGSYVVAHLISKESPNLNNFDKEFNKIANDLINRKQRFIVQKKLDGMSKAAKIVKNDQYFEGV